MTWKTLAGGADQLRAAHDGMVDQLGLPLTFHTETRARQPGQGYLAKTRQDIGPIQCYVFWDGRDLRNRGLQGDDPAGKVDRNGTWSAAFKTADRDALEPLASGEANGIWECEHPVYGRIRLIRVNPMQYQGQIIGYQAGAERIG